MLVEFPARVNIEEQHKPICTYEICMKIPSCPDIPENKSNAQCVTPFTIRAKKFCAIKTWQQ